MTALTPDEHFIKAINSDSQHPKIVQIFTITRRITAGPEDAAVPTLMVR